MENILRINPFTDVYFTAPLTDGEWAGAELILENICDSEVVYAITTNNPNNFEIRDTNGIIKPGECASMQLQLKAGNRCRMNDHFLIAAGEIESDTLIDDIEDWVEDNKDSLFYHGLVCKYTCDKSSSNIERTDGVRLDGNIAFMGDGLCNDIQSRTSFSNKDATCENKILIFPETELYFSLITKTASIRIENRLENIIVYLIRATNSQNYFVSSTNNFVRPGKYEEIKIRLLVKRCGIYDQFIVFINEIEKGITQKKFELLFKNIPNDSTECYKYWCIWMNLSEEFIPSEERDSFVRANIERNETLLPLKNKLKDIDSKEIESLQKKVLIIIFFALIIIFVVFLISILLEKCKSFYIRYFVPEHKSNRWAIWLF